MSAQKLRELRFSNDVFIEINGYAVTVTNRRSLAPVVDELYKLLKEYGVDIKENTFDPQGDDWP